MQLFRGYVKTKNKQCTEPFKGRTDLKTLEQVQEFPEFAGILGEETVLIDIDDFETSEILFQIVKDLELRCRVYKTTRGKHFLFKNSGIDRNKTGCKLAICLTADIKLGSSNSYSVLKFKGVDREILHDVPEDEIQDCPKWMFPIKTTTEFLDMAAGDGRNQSLFNYILTLQASDFTIEEARETIQIINKYILKNPLSERELKTILRDDAFKKPIFFKGTTFLFDKFATYLKNNNHIIRINGRLHIYKGGVYVSAEDEIESAMIKHISNLNKTKRKEVLSYLDLLIRDNHREASSNLIAFKNGVYNIIDDSFVDFSPQIVITNMIPWDYNPAAENDLVDSTIDKISCNDPEIRALLEECVGYCFYRRNELGKAFILTGEGANGKSTFIDMIKTMLGDENIASLDLKELGDRFKTAELFGKLANVGDDIGDEFIANASVFKKLVTGERVSVERKGQDPFEFNNYSKFLFSANSIPRMRDKTGAVQRRLTIIPFEARFTKEDDDFRPFIKYDLREQTAVERLILIGIEGLKRVIANNAFTKATKVDVAMKEYEEENNSIISFVNEFGLENIENEPTKNIYAAYSEYCFVNGLKEAYSNISFSKQIQKRYNFEIISTRLKSENNNVCRVFKKRM
jgi:putative DNA primase/helicase